MESDLISEATNPLFRRYVADQQYVRAFCQQHRGIARLWLLSSDYGRNLGLWFLWSVAFVVVFAAIYQWVTPEGFIFTNDTLGPIPSGRDKLYYSIVTFTTLGFGDIVPSEPWTRFWVAVEVVVGYVMLGGLISIFANKLERRS